MKNLLIFLLLLTTFNLYAQDSYEEIKREAKRIVDSATNVAFYKQHVSDHGKNPKVYQAKSLVDSIYSNIIKHDKGEISVDQLLSKVKPMEETYENIIKELHPIERKHVQLYQEYRLRETKKQLSQK